MKLSKSDLTKVENAVRSTKRTTKLVSLTQETWDQLSSIGLPIPKSSFTITGFLYGDRFNLKRFILNLTRAKLIKVTAYCLQRLDIGVNQTTSGSYLFVPARLSTIDEIYERIQADKVNPIDPVPEHVE